MHFTMFELMRIRGWSNVNRFTDFDKWFYDSYEEWYETMIKNFVSEATC